MFGIVGKGILFRHGWFRQLFVFFGNVLTDVDADGFAAVAGIVVGVDEAAQEKVGFRIVHAFFQQLGGLFVVAVGDFVDFIFLAVVDFASGEFSPFSGGVLGDGNQSADRIVHTFLHALLVGESFEDAFGTVIMADDANIGAVFVIETFVNGEGKPGNGHADDGEEHSESFHGGKWAVGMSFPADCPVCTSVL